MSCKDLYGLILVLAVYAIKDILKQDEDAALTSYKLETKCDHHPWPLPGERLLNSSRSPRSRGGSVQLLKVPIIINRTSLLNI